ncbi:MAG TPA: hypothetical protein ENH99_01165 [Candidatus Pacearchaeota archaeon]|nr:hypothetical protein [Candidatus Pacearchaeota archaeon]
MNLQFYMEKLHSSKIFQMFRDEMKDAYFCSGFFTLDNEGKDNQRHLDFYSPEKKQVFSFKLNSDVEILPTEKMSELNKNFPVPEKLSENIDFEFDEIEKLIFDEMEKKEMKTKIQKIIISLQNFHDRSVLVCTVFISMLGLLKVQIDLREKKIIEFEKKSFMDFVKKAK